MEPDVPVDAAGARIVRKAAGEDLARLRALKGRPVDTSDAPEGRGPIRPVAEGRPVPRRREGPGRVP